MKQNPHFILRELSGVPYLMPYGQMIADHKRGIKINESAGYFWNLLTEDHSIDEILAIGKEHFHIADEDWTNFRQDTTNFLKHLVALGILVEGNPLSPAFCTDERYLSIAGITIKLTGPKDIFPEEFEAFTIPQPLNIQQTIEFHIGSPHIYENGNVLVRNHELTVMELDCKYVITFPSSPQLIEMHVAQNGTHVVLYCVPPFTAESKESLFHAIRPAFLYLAQQKGMIALHSASILYKGKAWLFSGPSGTGKSTHTNLWNQLLDTPLVNGDLNLLALDREKPVIHGIPWCGTSDIFDTKTHPLGGIVLLKQAPSDFIEELTSDRKQLLVNLRLISPSWTKELFDCNLQSTANIVEQIAVCKLHCTKNESAVATVRKWIDGIS